MYNCTTYNFKVLLKVLLALFINLFLHLNVFYPLLLSLVDTQTMPSLRLLDQMFNNTSNQKIAKVLFNNRKKNETKELKDAEKASQDVN